MKSAKGALFPPKPAGLLIAAAVALYAAYWTRFYPGYFGDDAGYMLAAKSLLRGSYRALYLWNEPPETTFLPGYPLVLVPFLVFLKSSNPILRCAPMLWTAATPILMLVLFRHWLPKNIALAGALFFAFHPTTASYATTFMSDPFFVALTLASFCALRETLQTNTALFRWALAISLSWTMLTRPAGTITWVCAVAALVMARRWRVIGMGTGLPLAVWGFFVAYNHAVSGQVNAYVKFMGAEIASLPNLWLLGQNFIHVLQEVVVGQLLNMDVWVRPAGLVGALLTLAVVAICVSGVSEAYRGTPVHRDLLAAIALYMILYLAVLGLWLTYQDRYALPLLPLVAPFLFLGLSRLASACRLRIGTPILAGLLLLPGLGAKQILTIRATFSSTRPPESFLPHRTVTWICENIPAQEMINARSQPQLFLLTGHQGLGRPLARDREEARFLLLNASMHFVLLQQGPVAWLSGDSKANMKPNEERFSDWVRHWPKIFRQVYENPSEGTAIYQLAPDDRYLQAYADYRAAKLAFMSDHSAEGFQRLDRALQRYPSFATALNLYGLSLVLQGKDLRQAERMLRRSLEIMPGYPLAQLNLARLCLADHRRSEALTWLNEARRSIEDPNSNFRIWMPTLEAVKQLF